mmetsp:Transcript_32778/g.37473  ORF Transcript_32778/g.37473 Transcript_32778/m.37473 type:complete len:214 (-) Transcript_32778:903-1544(-)
MQIGHSGDHLILSFKVILASLALTRASSLEFLMALLNRKNLFNNFTLLNSDESDGCGRSAEELSLQTLRCSSRMSGLYFSLLLSIDFCLMYLNLTMLLMSSSGLLIISFGLESNIWYNSLKSSCWSRSSSSMVRIPIIALKIATDPSRNKKSQMVSATSLIRFALSRQTSHWNEMIAKSSPIFCRCLNNLVFFFCKIWMSIFWSTKISVIKQK